MPQSHHRVDKCYYPKVKVKVKSLSRVRLFATPWTTAYQAPPSLGLCRHECWGGGLAQQVLTYREVTGLLPSLCCQLPVVPLEWWKPKTASVWSIDFCFFPDSVPTRYSYHFPEENDLIFPWFLLRRAGMETSTFHLPGSSQTWVPSYLRIQHGQVWRKRLFSQNHWEPGLGRTQQSPSPVAFHGTLVLNELLWRGLESPAWTLDV